MQKRGKKIISIILFLLITIEIGFIIYNNINAKMMKNKLKEIKDNNSTFALMIEQTEGKSDYEEVDDDAWPSNDYKYNKDKSYCLYVDSDSEDKIKDILDFEDGKAIVKTTKTTYCYLYFDIQKDINFTFYLGGDANPKYTKTQNIKLYINTDNDNVNEYCISNTPDSASCIWKNISDLDYTLDNINGSQTKYMYLKTKDGEVSEKYQSDEIILDNISPSCYLGADYNGVTFYFSDNLELEGGGTGGSMYLGPLAAMYYGGSISDAAGNTCSTGNTVSNWIYGTSCVATTYHCESSGLGWWNLVPVISNQIGSNCYGYNPPYTLNTNQCGFTEEIYKWQTVCDCTQIGFCENPYGSQIFGTNYCW